ncbi:MAG: hypothetical protein ACREUQ_11145, partial [Burkholderiales bacterium]
LCNRFGVAQQRDWPVAAILAAAAGHGVQGKYWLCLDPVHLTVDLDRLVVAAAVKLSDQENAELFNFLSAHFAAHALTLVRTGDARWCVASGDRVRLTTCEFESAIGRGVDGLLPRGEDAPRWLRLLTEVQMLLHAHPVNNARDERGAPAVNSLWLWGGGILPEVPLANFAVASLDPLVNALAMLASAQLIEPPDDSNAIIGDLRSSATLAAPALDLSEGGAAQFHTLESQWLEPAWRALCNGAIDEFRLVATGDGRLAEFVAQRMVRFQFWRRAQPLAAVLAKIRVPN